MKARLLLLTVFSTFITMQAKTEAPIKAIELKTEVAVPLKTPTAFEISVDNFFTLLQASTDDSGYANVNSFLIPYKVKPAGMAILLSARRTIGGVANTTPAHIAVQGNNLAITAALFSKASYVGTEFNQYFYTLMANAVDGNNKKPIDYTTVGSPIYNFLLPYTI